MLIMKYVSITLFPLLLFSITSAVLSNEALAISTITLSPTSGPAGSTVSVTGSGFSANLSISILFDGDQVKTVTTDSSGSFITTFTVPSSKATGDYTVIATNFIDQTAPATFTVTTGATITLTPASGLPGTLVTVEGTKFPASKAITIRFDNNLVTTNPASITTTSSGGFSGTFTVPSSAAFGPYTVTASDGTNIASATFNVGATVTLVPNTGVTGTTVTILGSNFGANKPITVKFDNVQVATSPATVTTSSTGTFSATFVVPSSAAAGSHTVQVTDGTSSGSGSAIFTVSTTSTATITLNPTSGGAGSSVTISGSSFTASSSVTIKFDSTTIATTPTSVTVTASGTFSATITVPTSAGVGDRTISATDVAGKTASATFKVVIPAIITLSPTAGQPGTVVSISGSSFSSSSTVTVKFGSTTLVTTPLPLTTTASGTFSATVTVPNTATAGSHTITATDGTGKSGSATITISLGPVIVLSPTSGLTGSEVSVAGSNFTKNTEAKIKFGKITVATEPPKVVVGTTGTLSAKFIVPAGVVLGDHIVSVRDDTGRTGNATFTVKSSISPSVSLSSTSAAPGSTVTVTGSNFDSNKSLIIKFDQTIMITVTTTASGTFTATFAVPSTAVTGSHTISASDGAKNATATLTVALQTSQAALSLSSASATLGSSLTVSGSSFTPGSTVTIKLDGNNFLATAIATAGGSFTASINIPLTATLGSHTLSASDGTNSSSVTLSITEEIREKVTLSGVKLIDQAGSSVSRPSEGMQVLIQSDLKNNLASDQQFVYIVQVKDSNGATVMISWMSGTLPATKQYAVAQSWLAEQKGSYSVDVFVWQSISNPVVLAPASKATITVS